MTYSENDMDLIKEILKEVASHPGASEILEKANKGELSVMEAALQIQQLIEGTATANSLVKKMDHINDMGIDPDKMIWRHQNGEEGLNPIFEAKLAERLSQDGDIPELRVGPLPEGCRPAVPVLTYSPNPIAVGVLLKKAREKIENILEDQMASYVKGCEEGKYLVRPSPPIDVPHFYELGKTPLPMSLDPVTDLEVTSLTSMEKRQMIHSCIGTTQGRISCISPIQTLIRNKLQEKGIKEKVIRSSNRYESQWTVQTWGPEDISLYFNPITLAAESMVADFIKLHPDVKELDFNIRPINGYSDRVFGWKTTFNY